MPLDTPIPFDHSDDFENDLAWTKREDRHRYNVAVDRCEAIRLHPYKGDPKTGKMAGLYGEHVSDHWVLLYQLIPNLSTHAKEEEINLVYFHRYIHHDGQEDAVRSVERADSTLQFKAELAYDNGANSTISILHEDSAVEINAPQYQEYVSVTGTIPFEKKDYLIELVPSSDNIEFVGQSVEDVVD